MPLVPDASAPPSLSDPSSEAESDSTTTASEPPRQIALGGGSSANGLAQLVLTLVKLLHDLLEKQAIRRMDAGRLTDEEIEQVGQTLKRQAEEIEHLCDVFDLDPSDLDLSLGSVRGIEASDLE
jgi:hypothetical protein